MHWKYLNNKKKNLNSTFLTLRTQHCATNIPGLFIFLTGIFFILHDSMLTTLYIQKQISHYILSLLKLPYKTYFIN